MNLNWYLFSKTVAEGHLSEFHDLIFQILTITTLCDALSNESCQLHSGETTRILEFRYDISELHSDIIINFRSF